MSGLDEMGRVRGVGLGLRTRHYGDILTTEPDVPFFEVLADNYAHGGGPPLHFLERIRERYPIVLHGVGLSLGSTDPLARDYLARIRDLRDAFEPAWYSEHLAWTSVDGRHFHELLPLPWNEASVAVVADHVRQVQNEFGQRILVENSASYTRFGVSDLAEHEFVRAVLEEADCLLLLDVNNLHVNATNHGFDAEDYLRALPPERVAQMHLAGYDDRGGHLIDAHGTRVAEPVWQLFARASELFPDVPTCVEWDRDVPAWDQLMSEKACADEIVGRAAHERAGCTISTMGPRNQSSPEPGTAGRLRALQHQLAGALREQSAGGSASTRLALELAATARIEVATAIEIYRKSVAAALLDALRDIFPVCRALVGDDCFRSIVRRYDGTQGSSHADLSHAGDDFPDLLPQLDFLSSVPYLADVARLELAWHTAFSAPQPPTGQSGGSARAIGDAVGRAPDAHRFVLPRSATLLESRYPVLAIWQQHQEDEADEGLDAIDLDAAVGAGGDRMIVHRQGLDMRVDSLDAAEWRLLCTIEGGASVASSMARLADFAGVGNAGPVLDVVRTAFARGWIGAVEPVSA